MGMPLWVSFIFLNEPYEERVTPHGVYYTIRELDPLLSSLKLGKVSKFQACL